MNVMYLTWGETPRSYGVYNSQAISQFLNTSKIMDDSSFVFVAGIPLIHSGLVREKWKYPNELAKIKENLGDSVSFESVLIPTIQTFVNSSCFTFKLMHLGYRFLMQGLIKKYMPDVIHCRSYHAAWVAVSLRKKLSLNYKVVFDARGLWPEEIALKKNYVETSKSFQFLKRVEASILENSDVVLGVSNTMRDIYSSKVGAKAKTVYLSSSVSELSPVGYSLPQASGEIAFCYVGALSEDGWHKPSELLKLFTRLKDLFPKCKLTIVTTSNHEYIEREFSYFKGDFQILKSKNLIELKNIMRNQDIGLMSYFSPKNSLETKLASVVVAVKTAEYLAAGLPMICNRYCEGASSILEERRVGVSYDPSQMDEISKQAIVSLLDIQVRKRCVKTAEDFFDYSTNAKVYKSLYEDLTD